jgi:O-antigen/teichoic acid export membrane protein
MERITNDLTKGNVLAKLVLFAIPFLISNFIQSLYNVADMLIVGRFCGTERMSGVNIGGQVTFILTNTIVGLGAPSASAGVLLVIIVYLFTGKWKHNVIHHAPVPAGIPAETP